MKTNLLMALYVLVSLVVIIMLTLHIIRMNNSEGYKKCICSQTGDVRDCQSIEAVQNMYDNNELTEYTNLKSHGWGKTSPGDINYPVSKGCPWPDVEDSQGWQKWDFTDFGG